MKQKACKRVNKKASKSIQSFNENELSALLKAMSHPVRLKILKLLTEYKNELCSCDIEEHFHLSQPTISHHLKILKNAGILQSRQEGQWIYFSISSSSPVKVSSLLKAF